ncbi:MAG: hypothetical protein U5L07_12480 [Desulfobacterales bacterium]|nr:hypothetical protein [Desulfobacterales bacterium]
MKKAWVVVLSVLFLALGAAGTAFGAEATAGADVASAYVWRGITFNDGFVVQPYVDVAAGNGFAINVWGNYDIDDYDNTLDDNEFSEIDLTLSYGFSLEPVDITVGHIEYLFPNGGAGTSEVFLSAYISPLDGISAGIDAYYDYDEVEDYYVSASLAYDVTLDSGLGLGAGASAGYAGEDFTIGPDDGFHEYTFSANASYPVTDAIGFSAFIAYTDTFDEDVLPEQDVDLFGGGGFSWSF